MPDNTPPITPRRPGVRDALPAAGFTRGRDPAGSTNAAAAAQARQTRAAARFTARKPRTSNSQPPITGPATEPIAVATCRRVIRPARSSFGTSVLPYAWAAAMKPASAPWTRRMHKMSATLSASAIQHCVAASASRARRTIGLCPTRSPSRPHQGVKHIAITIGPA